MFCDAQRHTAFNNTDQRRFICIFDVIRPEYAAQTNHVCRWVLAQVLLTDCCMSSTSLWPRLVLCCPDVCLGAQLLVSWAGWLAGWLLHDCLIAGWLLHGCLVAKWFLHGCLVSGWLLHGCLIAGWFLHGCLVAGWRLHGCLVAGWCLHGCLIAGWFLHRCLVSGWLLHGCLFAGAVVPSCMLLLSLV